MLTVVGFVSGFISRYFLFRTAYSIEYDLRVLMYRHLSRMSFSFYDRVESGQLISRANSDIRSVQMFLAFGPFFIVQFALFGIAVFYMVQINLGLTLLALVTMPFVYKVGVRMRGLDVPPVLGDHGAHRRYRHDRRRERQRRSGREVLRRARRSRSASWPTPPTVCGGLR